LTVHCPVVFGSIAFWLGQKADESATHRWTLYVRGPNGENISYFVSKVVFFLHESFAQSVRTVTGTLKLICEAYVCCVVHFSVVGCLTFLV
jgi:transcription initiation factor IIF auxiliary subunit